MRLPILLLAASLLIGAAYYLYLLRVDFPPTAVRIVPVTWLLLSALSLGVTISRWRTSRRGALYPVLIIFSLVSIVLAALFTMGAALGD